MRELNLGESEGVVIKKSNTYATSIILYLMTSFILLVVSGCTVFTPYIPDTAELDRAGLPESNITTTIANLSNCTDAEDKSIQIDTTAPITILVHGCKSSAGHFRTLAQLYAFHGQQAYCYSYDDRGSLVDGAKKLEVAVDELIKATNSHQRITIMGHSMGGLVARKALEENTTNRELLADKNLELITVSAPLSGIASANTCGVEPLHWLSAGIVPGICWLITGNNWNEITSTSGFIQNPTPLLPSVRSYLKIVTNEENTCRKTDQYGTCIESDYVFNLAEQYHPIIDNYSNVTGVQVNAGHVEIVGNKRIIPRKLLAILQRNGALSNTPKARKNEFEILLAELY